MGEVVKGRFGPKPKNVSAEPQQEQLTELQFLTEEVRFIMQEKEKIKAAFTRADEITNYIFSLRGFFKKDENVDLRQAALRDTPISSLVAHLLESNQGNWSTQPHFYGAVLLELDGRVQSIQAYIDGMKD